MCLFGLFQMVFYRRTLGFAFQKFFCLYKYNLFFSRESVSSRMKICGRPSRSIRVAIHQTPMNYKFIWNKNYVNISMHYMSQFFFSLTCIIRNMLNCSDLLLCLKHVILNFLMCNCVGNLGIYFSRAVINNENNLLKKRRLWQRKFVN